MAKEKFFWADQIADRIIKEKGNKKEYVCASGITPSGTIHIGNFREVITTELVVRALQDKGKKVRFIYSWDDYDRFRKVPVGIDKKYEKYLGMPVSEVPSPFKKGESYAEHFEKEFENSLKKVGVKPEFIRQNVMFKKCKYASLIKVAIEKRKEIMKILNKHRKEPLKKDWMPVTVYCEKCGKDFTKIISAKGYFIEYECKCGFKDKIDYRKKGFVKVLWRVDWPMRWKYEKVDFEPGGADHSAAGGSFETGKEIVKKVFNYGVPLYYIYLWIRLKGGKDFSSSQGNALNLDEVEEVYEPEVIRYLFVGTRPSKEFNISFDNDIIKIYEDYDALEKKYYGGEANPQEKRIYELSQVKKPAKKKPEKMGFRHLITSVQLKKEKELNKESQVRAKKVANWIEKYAGEDMKFEVKTKVSARLEGREKEAMKELKKSLENKDFSEEELFNEFYRICEKLGMKNKEFFDAAYKVLIGKSRGPRLASLILMIGKGKLIKLLGQVK
ncbi:lysine--tRNA ligase [Candidatus Pacearchaeota archaeon]|nr:lysine--tRNA ligase [Candidatus Pacearchaeota archaeon]